MYLLEQLIDLLAPTNANCNKILVLKTINEHVHMSMHIQRWVQEGEKQTVDIMFRIIGCGGDGT